jgi:hypothetical protein
MNKIISPFFFFRHSVPTLYFLMGKSCSALRDKWLPFPAEMFFTGILLEIYPALLAPILKKHLREKRLALFL